MEAAGHLVRVLIEFSAGMQDGQNDFGSTLPFFMCVDGNPSTVVLNSHRTIRMNHHIDLIAVTCQGLINRVIHDLKHHMMQACAVIGVADIHPRTLFHSLKPF